MMRGEPKVLLSLCQVQPEHNQRIHRLSQWARAQLSPLLVATIKSLWGTPSVDLLDLMEVLFLML